MLGGGPLVRAGRDRADRADHADATAYCVTCRAARMPGAITPITGMSTRACEWFERGRGRAVARDDEHLDAAVEQTVGDLERVLAHLVGRLRSVREPAGVTEVDDVLVGKQVDERPHDGETAEAAVEHSDRTPVARHRRQRYRCGCAELAEARCNRSHIAAPIPSPGGGTASDDVEPERVGFAEPGVEHAGVLVDVATAVRAPRPLRRAARRRAGRRCARRPTRSPASSSDGDARDDRTRRRRPRRVRRVRSATASVPGRRDLALVPVRQRCAGDARRSPSALDRRRRGGSRARLRVTSTIVDSTPTRLGPPSSTTSTSSPRSARTCAAVVGLTRPKRFADGAAMPPPNASSNASATGWSGTRRPTVGATAGRRVGDAVGPLAQHERERTGPERRAPARARRRVRRCAYSSSVGAGRDVHDHRMVGGSALHAVQPAQRVGVRGVGAEPVHGLGRERDESRRARSTRDRFVDVRQRSAVTTSS